MRTLVWFRGKDLRLADHAPLRDAAEQGEVVPLFVLDPYFFAPARAREMPHRMQYLVAALAELQASLERLGSRLIVVEGRSVDVVPRLARAWKVDRVVAHRWVEPFARERDRRVAAALHVPFELFEGETLLPPGALKLYSVFTPFSRAFLKALEAGAPRPAPRRLSANPIGVASVPLPRVGSAPLPAGERAARARLTRFDPSRYAEVRDRLDLAQTSRLSADLHFGTVSAREVWHRTREHPVFANELVWREYAHAVLWHRPDALDHALRPEWRDFPFRDDERGWRAWTQGLTGYPIVDAAARQLLGEGFVHNRARMISASFLTRDLMIDYRRGEAWFMKWLVDGDWANNDAGWQWSFGSGLDAQPYFRVFAPLRQAERFDPTGAYVDRWVPELRALPLPFKHAPWTAPQGLRPPDYPPPIVDHAFARERFIATARRATARRARR